MDGRVLALGLAAGLSSACAAVAPRQGSSLDAPPRTGELALTGRQLSFGAGLRSYEDAAFGRLDDQILLSLDYCEPMGLDALRLEGGLHYTYDAADDTRAGGQDVRLKAESLELSAGLNYSALLGRVRPYVGAGAALQFLNLRGLDDTSDTVFDDDDAVVGGYLKGGILFQVSRTSHVGVEIRHFEGGVVTLDGTDLDTDYDQLVLLFGTSFE